MLTPRPRGTYATRDILGRSGQSLQRVPSAGRECAAAFVTGDARLLSRASLGRCDQGQEVIWQIPLVQSARSGGGPDKKLDSRRVRSIKQPKFEDYIFTI